jgi:transcriptional regulator with XRE-family HTH domain
MAGLKMGKPLTEGAPKAAASMAAKARQGTAKVGSGVETLHVTLGDYLREQRRGAQLTLRQLADQAGVSNPYLSQIERGLRRPSAEVLQQLAKALRISAETLYVRAGILEADDSGGRAVTVAILGDLHLTERQRQALLDIYQSFRRQNEPDHTEPSAAGGTASGDSAATLTSRR